MLSETKQKSIADRNIWYRRSRNRKRVQRCYKGRYRQTLVPTIHPLQFLTRTTVIPKANSIFAFAVPLYSTLPATHTPVTMLPLPPADEAKDTVLDGPHILFELYGNQFCFRSADRAGRKFKAKETIEL